MLFLVFIILFYMMMILVVYFYGNRQLKKLNDQSNSHRVISILWAWSDYDNITTKYPHLISDDGLLKHPKKKNLNSYSLFNLIAILLIIIYQVRSLFNFYKSKKNLHANRMCIYSPSCSNYAIGILHRYNFFKSIKMINSRLRRCNGRENSIDFY